MSPSFSVRSPRSRFFTLLFVAALALPFSGRAQVDHVQGAKGMELSAGGGENSVLVRLGYYHWLKPRFFLRSMLTYNRTLQVDDKGYRLTRYGLDVWAHYNIWNYRGKIYATAGVGMGTAWNDIGATEGDLATEGKMKFGFLGGGELEARLVKSLMAVLAGDARYMLADDFGAWRIYGTLGLRYTF